MWLLLTRVVFIYSLFSQTLLQRMVGRLVSDKLANVEGSSRGII